MTAALAAGLGISLALVVRPRHRPVAAIAAAALWQPLALAVVAMVAGVVAARRRLLGATRRARHVGDAEILFAELLGLGVGSGLTLHNAAEMAASEVGGPVAVSVTAALRRSSIRGAAQALASATGPASDLMHLVARATATGSPMSGAIEAYVSDARGRRRAARLAATRRLPVRLLLPLTLLILPGFIVLTLGPALLSGLDRIRL